MARPLRIQYEGAFYHVTARGDRRRRIFLDDTDKECFLNVLYKAKKRCSFILHAFVLMNNHYHLLIETPKANLSATMHYINALYTQRFNHRHRSVGHVLQGRFKSIVVDKNEYYLELIRYIHLNPVRAGIVRKVDAYKWSSHAAIINDYVRKCWLNIYDPTIVLSYFGKKKITAKIAYNSFISDGYNLTREDIFRGISYSYILGEEEFVDWVRRNFVDEEFIDKEIEKSSDFSRGFDTDEVLRVVGAIFNVSRKQLLKVRRGCNSRNSARLLSIHLLARHSTITQRELGKLFGGVSDVAISKAAKFYEEHMLTDKNLQNAYAAAVDILGYVNS